MHSLKAFLVSFEIYSGNEFLNKEDGMLFLDKEPDFITSGEAKRYLHRIYQEKFSKEILVEMLAYAK